jgi:hypothetical protein
MRPFAVLAVWLGCVAGCGSQDAVVPVSGTVTFQGAPLAKAWVKFNPIAEGQGSVEAGVASYARTDEQGKFELKTIFTPEQTGAVPGRHRVRIQSVEGGGDSDAGGAINDPIPLRYRDGSEVFEVPAAGTDQANFDIPAK